MGSNCQVAEAKAKKPEKTPQNPCPFVFGSEMFFLPTKRARQQDGSHVFDKYGGSLMLPEQQCSFTSSLSHTVGWKLEGKIACGTAHIAEVGSSP